MQCNAMQCNAMQCNAMQCNAMQCKSWLLILVCQRKDKLMVRVKMCYECKLSSRQVKRNATDNAKCINKLNYK